MSNRARTRAALLATIVLGTAAASACGSSASTDASTASTATTASTTLASTPTSAATGGGSSGTAGSASGSGSSAAGGDCTVDGEVRGDDTARYIARPATVSLTNAGAGAPPAFYQSTQTAMVLSLYAEGAAPANVIWTTTPPGGAETSYTSSPSSTGIDIAADGSGATVKTTLESNDGKSVEVDLTVTC